MTYKEIPLNDTWKIVDTNPLAEIWLQCRYCKTSKYIYWYPIKELKSYGDICKHKVPEEYLTLFKMYCQTSHIKL